MRLYDSKRQETTDFVPIVAGQVGLYVCGPTVQSSPHIGHLRSALVYDLWRRWLNYRGLTVTLVRNVTDIDDKILANATEAEPWWALAYRVELEFTNAYNALGILPPTYEPRATASIREMLALITRLIDGGHAYPAPDGSGDVYFDTVSWPSYGELTRQKATTWSPRPIPTRAESATLVTSPSGRDTRRTSQRQLPGTPRGAPAGRAGTSSAPR